MSLYKVVVDSINLPDYGISNSDELWNAILFLSVKADDQRFGISNLVFKSYHY